MTTNDEDPTITHIGERTRQGLNDGKTVPIRGVIDGNGTGKSEQDGTDTAPSGANDEAIVKRIQQLDIEHADLHAAIEALAERAGHEDLSVARLKKRKLLLKDQIGRLRDQLTPDIIA